RAPEGLVHFFGIGVGGDVEVLGTKAEQQVAHRAAHDIRLIAVAVEHLADLARALRDRLAADAVLLLRDGSRSGIGAESEDAPDAHRESVRITCAWWFRSRCCSGSSSSRMSVSCRRSCAMRARWRSPPESVR